MNLKKIIALLLAVSVACLSLAFAACEKKEEDKKDEAPKPQSFMKEAATGERNDYGGSVGYEFECLADMTVSAVGRPENGGMTGFHNIYIWEKGGDAPLAKESVSPGSTLEDGFYVKQLETPIKLKAGTSYRIVCAENKDGDKWYDFGTSADAFPDLKPTDDCKIITPVFTGEGDWDSYPANEYLPEGAVNKGYVGVTFYYLKD